MYKSKLRRRVESTIRQEHNGLPVLPRADCEQKKTALSFDNVVDALVYIKEQYGTDTLLGEKVYTYFADLTRNQFRDETDLIKQLCEKGALDYLKTAIAKPNSEHENAIKRALSKLPKYLQDSQTVMDMLHDFAAALGWKITKTQQSVAVPQSAVQQSQIIQPYTIIQPNTYATNRALYRMPTVGSIYKFAGIDWRVLAVVNNHVLLISEKILERRPYNVQLVEVTWETCTLRKYLNGEFYNSLCAPKSAIFETPNNNNLFFDTAVSNTTIDKVFLLSGYDFIYYFIYKNTMDGIANYGNEGASWWWLRSPGPKSYYASCIDAGGNSYDGFEVNRDFLGVRPALWLNL